MNASNEKNIFIIDRKVVKYARQIRELQQVVLNTLSN